MKGISPIIGIIIILLITIAIAGAAYSYISTIWGRTTEGVQMISSDCARINSTDSNATFLIRNIGTKAITSITMTRTNPTGTPNIVTPGNIDAGENSLMYDDICPTGNLCTYRIVTGGQSQEAYAQC